MPGGSGGGGDGTNDPYSTIDYASLTNGLWLELTNRVRRAGVSEFAQRNRYRGVYEILSKTDLIGCRLEH